MEHVDNNLPIVSGKKHSIHPVIARIMGSMKAITVRANQCIAIGDWCIPKKKIESKI